MLLFNHGLFFDAHEHLEAFWRKAQGEPKIFLQGLIQIAAAFHKLELDPEALAGARELLEEGLAKLERTGRAPEARAALRPALERLRAGRSPSDVPRLEVIHKNFPGSFCE
ncbi:MAG: DUF309 domain-containing protein [Elusimicrobia bacterium]|nr:DUF309 domain-containing protein [Elusimicrobiota bacterium]